MAFTVRNMSVLNYANGYTTWHYKAKDETIIAVVAPGYFNPAADMLTAGDVIIISLADGAAMRAVRKVEHAGTVTIGPML